ncbi:hypothetical protein [Amycolatopsis aidingensis]|uniref:hypothetical protein n=1 Tax=Amycolatopsis aidingensis TaxID=2842453 RepID=UPI001C0E194C|nr:hypothetical protein [Amycolatopsis aidingensis]
MTTASTVTAGTVAVPRWAKVAAYAAALSTVPSCLWRIALGLQVPLGFTEAELRALDIPGSGTAYVFGLSVLAQGFALLTLGLVQRWGETIPRWVPALGGRRIPPLAAIIPALLGAVAVTVMIGQWALSWGDPSADMPNVALVQDGAYSVLMTACYAPLLLWGPLLAVVTVHYRRRRGTR